MGIAAEQEQRFYDDHYARHLDTPDAELAIDRFRLLADLSNPARTIYERRGLYTRVLDVLLDALRDALPAGAPARPVVLDYGCGLGEWGVLLATEGAQVTLLDLSPVAIRIGLRRAAASGASGRVRGVARDASDLSCFADGEFDLIYANAAVHHTLKYPHALDELVRVLRPGGKLVLAETYGNNRLLNLVRRLGWRLGGQPEEAGEDILFGERELRLLRARFRRVETAPLSLLAMAKRLFRGRFESRSVRGFLRLLEAADTLLLRAFPAVGRYCGEVVVVAEK